MPWVERFHWARRALLLASCGVVVAPMAMAEDKTSAIGDLDEKLGDAKISKGTAMNAALKTMPGKVTDVTVERKRGKQVYVIEIIAESNGKENDVLVDMQTGAVLGIDQ